MYYCTRESEIGNNILDRWYSKKGIWNRIKKALGHKIPETKIEEIINEGIEKKKEKEVVVEINKLMTNTSKNGNVIKLVDTLEDGSSQKE